MLSRISCFSLRARLLVRVGVDVLLAVVAAVARSVVAMEDGQGIRVGRLLHILVILDMEVSSKILRPKEGKDDDIDVDTGHELEIVSKRNTTGRSDSQCR